MTNACVCLVGWYFNQDLIQAIQSVPGIHLFVISHQPPMLVPEYAFQVLSENQLFFEKNIGYDWGAYQQFIEKNIWRNYETIFFMHDDLTILDLTLFSRCHDMIRSHGGKIVIGNGRNSQKRDWPRTHIQSYAHSVWKPPTWTFEHDTVRGSFFALSRETLEKIIFFEIFWDRLKLCGVGAGNHSLRATCGKIHYTLGNEPFYFLSETYRQSPYLIELERGQEQRLTKNVPFFRLVSNKALVSFARMLMKNYMSANPTQKRRIANFMQFIYNKI